MRTQANMSAQVYLSRSLSKEESLERLGEEASVFMPFVRMGTHIMIFVISVSVGSMAWGVVLSAQSKYER
jgi:hypothetical protein